MYWLILGIALFIISIYGVSVTAGDMLLTLVLRKKSVKYTGDHLFIARTFSSKVRSMSVTMGTLSMLVVLTLLSLNVSYLNQGMSGYTLELEAPYDVDVFDDYEDREILNDYIPFVEEDYHIEETFTFDVCKEPKMQLFPITGSLGSNTDFDPVISLSTYNTLLEMKGREAVFLADDEYIILADRQLVSRFEEASGIDTITLTDGSTLDLKMITDTGYWMSITNYASFIAVFPDRCVEGLEPVESHLIIDTEEETSADLAHKLRDEMSWHLIRTDESGEVTDKRLQGLCAGTERRGGEQSARYRLFPLPVPRLYLPVHRWHDPGSPGTERRFPAQIPLHCIKPSGRQRQPPLQDSRKAAPHPVRTARGVPSDHYFPLHDLRGPAVQHASGKQPGVSAVFPRRARHLPSGVSGLFCCCLHWF